MNIQNIMYIQDWKPQCHYCDGLINPSQMNVTDGSLGMSSSSNYVKVLWSQTLIVVASIEYQSVTAHILVRIHFYISDDLLLSLLEFLH